MTDQEVEEKAEEITTRLINSKGETWVDILTDELKKLLQ